MWGVDSFLLDDDISRFSVAVALTFVEVMVLERLKVMEVVADYPGVVATRSQARNFYVIKHGLITWARDKKYAKEKKIRQKRHSQDIDVTALVSQELMSWLNA